MQAHALRELPADVKLTESMGEVVFDPKGIQPGPNAIQIHEIENRLEFVEQVLIAATDEPRYNGQL